MFKRAIWVVLQTLLFLLLFAAGSFLPVLPNFSSLYWGVSTGPGRVFVMDGLLLMLIAFALIVVGEAIAKRLRGAGLLTTLSLVLALLLGLAMKIGFKAV